MKKLFLIMLLSVCIHFSLYAQVTGDNQATPAKPNISLKDIVTKLQTLATEKVIEKAYLHFDRSYYNPGDTIYFKAYVVAGERHELSKISGVLHVDLISKNDSVMQSHVLKLSNGQAAGDFALPVYSPKGRYRVRAYTQWMRNEGDKYFFDQIIQVTGRSISKVVTASGTAHQKADVQFFPEGGSFVNSLPCKIAFKAVGNDGLGIHISGTIVDDQNKEITRFASAHLGMGQFYITAAEGRNYKAKITNPDGSSTIFDLPKADVKGITLTVNNSNPDKLAIDINANKAYYLENKNKEINVVIYAGGIIKTVKTVLDNQVIGFDVPKKDLKTGIAQVTLFSSTGQPLNERLAYIRGNDIINMAINAKPVYAANESANITITTTEKGNAVSGYYSVAVSPETDQVNDHSERSILSDVLLTSELKGFIEQPGFYFTDNTDANAYLDILMLTQGYRRFEWNGLLNEAAPLAVYKPESGLQISGHLKLKNGRFAANEKITLLLSSSGQSITSVTDNSGKFVFENLDFDDKTNFILKVENSSIKKQAEIMLDKPNMSLPVKSNRTPASKIENTLYTNNEQNTDAGPLNVAHTKALKQVNVNDKAVYRSSNLGGSGNADQVIFNKDFKNVTTLSQGLSGRAKGVKFSNGLAYLQSSLIISAGVAILEPMLIIVDGIVGAKDIDIYNPIDVESVEILKGTNAAIYGVVGGAGVIVINTRQGGIPDDDNAAPKVMSPGLLSLKPLGFYQARQFYSPRYPVNDIQSNNLSKTIYWNPDIITDDHGNASFNLPDAKKNGKYHIVVEGINKNGGLGRYDYTYQVK